MTSTTGIRLEEKVKKRVKKLAELKDRSPHWIMKTAVEEYLDREEARERELQEDMARWQEYKRTGIAYSMDEVFDGLEKMLKRKKK